MKKVFNKIYIAATIVLASLMSSCIDDNIISNEEIGEGNAKIAATVSFKNFTPGLTDSRGTAGEELNSLKNLYIFAYSEDGSELLYTTNFTKAQLNPTNTNTQKPDGATSQVETPTESATFNFPLPYGKYKIYAVANIPEQYVAYFGENQVPNETALKSISFPWNSNDIAANAEMFGWFSTQAFTSMNISGENAFDAPVVTINKNGVTLNAWLRRLASKVTVSFDPGNLNEGVTIYIKSATIRHIPVNCTLGATNT
ncbi:MAG: DUF3820 family protein, partial [Paramuribaculum sp.]|nr:DUF3820 family protein [Paramuribaculum sp.]